MFGFKKRALLKRQREHWRGYNYGAGQLLSCRTTLRDLEVLSDPINDTPYDRGVREAIRDWEIRVTRRIAKRK